MILYFFLATQALPKSVAYYFEHLCMLFGFEGELDTILFFASGCRSHCGGGSLTSSAMGIKVNLSWCPDYCASRGLYGFKPAPTSLITEAENPGLEESTAIFDWENKSSQVEDPPGYTFISYAMHPYGSLNPTSKDWMAL